jgi:excisionase family DNA binding protein
MDNVMTGGVAKLLTVKAVAQALAISRRTLEREIACGSFPRPVKIGRATRIPVGDVELYLDWLEERRKAGAK